MPRAVDVVRRVAPRARPSYVAAFENGDALLIAHGITTPDRLAHFLAQILHESGGLELEWENMSYRAERLVQVFGVGCHSAAITPGEARALAHRPSDIAERVYGLGNPRKAQELGNTQPGDGFRYRGGGLLQTTGRDNYRRMGQKCGVDFEGQPDLVLSAEHALKPALGEWTEARLNAFADCSDILSISRAINLGSPRSPRIPNGMEDRVAWFANVRPLIRRVEFAPGAAEAQPQTAPVQAPPAGDVAEPNIAEITAGRILRFGDRGSDVQAVQRALARLGYDLQGTGNYGANTQNAVADFQARHGLEVDGEVGLETAGAIDAALAHVGRLPTSQPDLPQAGAGALPLPSPQPATPPSSPPAASPAPPALAARLGDRTLRIGDAGDLVRAVQLALAPLGYDLKGSGNYGANTQRAVADFQARHDLEVDGEVGAETAGAIDAVLAHAGRPGMSQDGIPQDGISQDDLPQADAPRPLLPSVAPPLVAPPSPPPDGSPAAPTLAALLGDRALQMGDEGDLVRAFQLALARLGYDLKGTGTFGGATDTAVTHFQQTHDIEVDGELGPETAAAIDAALARAGQVGVPTIGVPSAGGPAAGVPTIPAVDAGQPIWLLEGLKWMNTREEPGSGNNRDIIEWAREEGGATATTYDEDSIPWCALYANMVLTKVGLRGTKTLWALDWSNWGTRLAGPAVGAFAPMKRSGGGHIAIIAGRDQHGNLMCLGGNQSDAVNIKPFPADRPVSFRWPKDVPLPARTGFATLPLVQSDGRVSSREA
jgi:uncharacterized protein (TIGR02594 family)